jgi:hypothetical protein
MLHRQSDDSASDIGRNAGNDARNDARDDVHVRRQVGQVLDASRMRRHQRHFHRQLCWVIDIAVVVAAPYATVHVSFA